MSDIAAFYAARLDETEAAAKAAADCEGHHAPGWMALTASGIGWVVDAADPDYAITTDTLSEIVTHIARHDPSRVLREVEAGRKILTRYEFACHQADLSGAEGRAWEKIAGALERDVLDLASVYSDHEAYDPAWADLAG